MKVILETQDEQVSDPFRIGKAGARLLASGLEKDQVQVEVSTTHETAKHWAGEDFIPYAICGHSATLEKDHMELVFDMTGVFRVRKVGTHDTVTLTLDTLTTL